MKVSVAFATHHVLELSTNSITMFRIFQSLGFACFSPNEDDQPNGTLQIKNGFVMNDVSIECLGKRNASASNQTE